MKTHSQIFSLIGTLCMLGTSQMSLAAPLCAKAHGELSQTLQAPLQTSSLRMTSLDSGLADRIDSLIELQLKLQSKDFNSKDQLQMALEYFERETQGLQKAWPQFTNYYRERFPQVRSQNLSRQRKAEQNKVQKEREQYQARLREGILEPKLIHTFGTIHHVTSLAVTPDGNYFVAGLQDSRKAVLYDLRTYSAVHEFNHGRILENVDVSSNGKVLVTTGTKKSIRFDLENRTEIEYDVHHELSSSYSPNRRFLVKSGDPDKLLLFDLNTKKMPEALEIPSRDVLPRFSPQDNFLIVSTPYQGSHLFDLKTKTLIATFKNESKSNPRRFDSISFTPDEKYLLVSDQNKVHLYDLEMQRTVYSLDLGLQRAVTITPDHRYLIATTGWDLSFYDLPSGQQVKKLRIPGNLESLAISQDSKILIIGARDRIHVVNLYESSGDIPITSPPSP